MFSVDFVDWICTLKIGGVCTVLDCFVVRVGILVGVICAVSVFKPLWVFVLCGLW